VAHTIHGGGVETSGLFGDRGRHRHFVEECERRSFSRGDLARTLVADPASFRRSLLATLERCREEFFDAEWAHLHGRLTDEVARLRAQRHQSAVEMLCAVSASAVRVGDTGIVRFDKLQNLRVTPEARSILLVPTVVGRPHLIVRGDPPYPVVVQFPISTPGALATLGEIQSRLATLSDPNRLAICRHLVNEAITTSDLARRIGMAPPQVSRHLARLRAAGLLVSERDGRFVYHRLDVAAVMQLGPQLISSIVR
jgi:DNA-binding transcriptional ArsR family regulator